MADYVLYQVHLSNSKQTNLNLQHQDATNIHDNAQKYFGRYFDGKTLDLYKKNKDGEITRHPNDILRKTDDVILLRINNVQMKSIYRREEKAGGIPDYKEEKMESNPFSYVIIDNRPGYCRMAIEKSYTWGSSTDAVKDLLENWFNDQLSVDCGLNINIDVKWQETEFWAYVDRRFKESGDVITQVKFDLLNPTRIKPYNQPKVPLSGFVKAMNDTTKLMDMLKTTIIMDADGKGKISNETKYEDIAQMVSLCSCNAYHLSVTFRDHGEYKCNDMIKAVFTLKDNVISDFINGTRVLCENNQEGKYELIRMLDDIQEQTVNFKNGNKTQRKAKGKAKKQF